MVVVDYTALSRKDQQIAEEVFNAHCTRNFATGLYESTARLPVNTACVAGAAATSLISYAYHVNYKDVKCVANVPGLDSDAFMVAVAEFVKLSREATFDAINIDNDSEEDNA